MPSLPDRAAATYVGWLAHGHEVADAEGVRFVHGPATPQIYDANFVSLAGAAEADVDGVFDEIERRFGHLGHRHAVTGPATAPQLLARLALEGYRPDPTLQLVLEGELRGPAPVPVEVHEVAGDSSWATYAELHRLDMDEGRAKAGQAPYDPSVPAQMAQALRAKSPGVRFCFARVGGRDVAYFSSWVGPAGMGMVENLFTHPEHRKRGIARALLHHCVGACRAEGAREVLVGADPSDTPMRLYAAMGFAPTCLTWSWVKSPADA